MKTFKVGDKVAVLDDDLSGVVVSQKHEKITISTSDGFELEFEASELVLIDKPLDTNFNVSSVLNDKESSKKRHTPKLKKKEKFQPTMEVDLHIHQLTEKPQNMAKHDMLTLQLDTARRQLEFAINKRIQKIVFIHGVGEGVLKMELEYLFGRYNNVKFYEADYQKYGLGATEVYVYQNVKSEY